MSAYRGLAEERRWAEALALHMGKLVDDSLRGSAARSRTKVHCGLNSSQAAAVVSRTRLSLE